MSFRNLDFTPGQLDALLIGGGVLLVLLFIRLVRRAKGAVRLDKGRLVVVDGSNVMHWGGDASVHVLHDVLNGIRARRMTPIVYFDANAGYKLFGRHTNSHNMARRLGLGRKQAVVMQSGVPADGEILAFAARHGLNVVTNDRFRDWREEFPQVDDTVDLIRGGWKNGKVSFRRRLEPQV